jgi:hypothetical protein
MTSAAADPARGTAEQTSLQESAEPQAVRAEASRLRGTVARRLADLLFLPSGQLSPAEKALIDSLLAPLFDCLDASEKERLARRVAELRDMPPQLARRMARDEPDIARLVLERADMLDEQDLAMLVKTGSLAHQLAVAMRPQLPSSVADALIATGRADVIEAVLRNASAKLSRRVFRYLVELSRRDGRFPPFLLARNDLPVDIAHELFWYVESPLRWEVIMRFGLERRLMADALSDLPANETSLADEPVRAVMSVLGLSRPEPAPAERLAETLGAWLRAEGTAGVPVLRWSGIGKTTLERIRKDPWGEPQTVLFKALGAPKSALVAVKQVLVPRWPERERPLRVAHLAQLFDSMARDWAELLLRLWDRKQGGVLDEFIEELRVNGSSSGGLPSSQRAGEHGKSE